MGNITAYEKKKEQKILFAKLSFAVSQLNSLLGGNSNGTYKAHIKLRPFDAFIQTFYPGQNKKIRVEIRTREDNHQCAHFHISLTGENQSASYRIDNFEKLSGNIPLTVEKKILQWAYWQKDLLKVTWEKCHGKAVVIA